jgi:hypothetical protein
MHFQNCTEVFETIFDIIFKLLFYPDLKRVVYLGTPNIRVARM